MREQNEPTKLSITGKTLAGLAGQVFKDGPYEYRIYVKTGDLGDDTILSISIFIENSPPYLGVDLYLMALQHVAEVAGEHIDNSEWMINKVILEEHESLGEMTSMITGQRGNIFGLQSYRSLEEKIKTNLNKKLDFQQVNDAISIRIKKLTKVLNYIQKKLTTLKNMSSKMTYTISGEAKRFNDDLLAPSIKAEINVELMETRGGETFIRSLTGALKEEVYNMIEDYSPIDIHSYDNISINVKPYGYPR